MHSPSVAGRVSVAMGTRYVLRGCSLPQDFTKYYNFVLNVSKLAAVVRDNPD